MYLTYIKDLKGYLYLPNFIVLQKIISAPNNRDSRVLLGVFVCRHCSQYRMSQSLINIKSVIVSCAELGRLPIAGSGRYYD